MLSAFSPPEGAVESHETLLTEPVNLTLGGRELLNIAVEIGDGKSANILIRENDDPIVVSHQFAGKHGLSE